MGQFLTNMFGYSIKQIGIAVGVGIISILLLGALFGDSQPLPFAPSQDVIFDLQTLFGKSLPQLEVVLGAPVHQGQPDEYSDGLGWAEWDKDGLTLLVNYDEKGDLIDTGTVIGCAMTVYPQNGYWEETKLRQASNLSQPNDNFVIQPTKNQDGAIYQLEICRK